MCFVNTIHAKAFFLEGKEHTICMKNLEAKKQQKYIPKSQISGLRLGWLREIFRKIHNFVFVNHAKRRGLRLGAMSLDKQQTEVVVACEDAQLVLASAGSGKTMSLLAKVEYLVNELKLRAENILVISFTSKTVKELVERCSVKGVQIRTFHSLGNQIISEQSSGDLGKKKLISPEETSKFIKDSILKHAKSSSVFARKLNDYILFYLSAPVAPGQGLSLKDFVSYNRLYLRLSLRDEFRKEFIEKGKIRGDFIRSKEEQILANWLTIHGVNYKYRQNFKDLNYKPSFTCGDIYIDFAAIDKRGKSMLGKSYYKDLCWRCKIHAHHKTKYLELESWRWAECELLNYAKEKLEGMGLKCERLDEDKIFWLIQKYYSQDFEAFLKQLETFLSLFKNSMLEFKDLRKRAEKAKVKYERYRAKLFLGIFEVIYKDYEEYLELSRLYDFADMINEATWLVRSEPSCMRGCEYILVDEVQDLSPNRQQLICAILDKNPKCRLFAVGDDWQSIYRFTGSNLELINKFEQYFCKYTRRSLIETTHRFGAPTLQKSCAFVERNPLQIHKRARSSKKTATPIEIVLNDENSEHFSDVSAFEKAIKKLHEEYGYEKLSKMELQIISRFNSDIDRLEAENIEIKDQQVIWRSTKGEELKFEFCSMHKSKGITRDIVIVLNMNSDIMGMPAQRENDPLLDMLLAKEEPFAFAEERRLFYVAITRARLATILLANPKNPSPFLLELSPKLASLKGELCPRCETGQLIKKNDKKGILWYCSNFPYGCNFIRRAR